jgi:hypothetical protein
MFRASHCSSSGATTTTSSLWFTVGAVVCGRAGGKPEAAISVVAPDDGHEDARNMFSCI